MSVADTRDTSPAASPDLEGHSTSTPPEVFIGAHRRSPWIVPAALFGAYVVLVVLLYASARHTFAGDSDGATVVLQGQAMGGGNVTLHGWALSLDSFWTVDAVAYMFVEWVTGVRDALLFLVPSMIAGAVVIVGALLAKDRRRGSPASPPPRPSWSSWRSRATSWPTCSCAARCTSALRCSACARSPAYETGGSGGAGSRPSCAWPPASSATSRQPCSASPRSAPRASSPCCARAVVVPGGPK